jgi:branched-chain amino acid transport system substrate-binding protein
MLRDKLCKFNLVNFAKGGRAMKRLLAVLVVLFVVMMSTVSWAENVKEVKIGSIYPMSGSLAKIGATTKNAIDMAVEIINTKSDVPMKYAATEGLPNLGGAKIKVIWADHQAKPEVGMAEAERLITSEKVHALFGCYNSSVTATASQAAERRKMPFVNGESASPTLTERGFKWFFRTTPTDDFFSKMFFEFLKNIEKEKGYKVETIANVYENTLWGTDSGKFIAKHAKNYGYKVVLDMPYTHRTADLTAEVQKLKSVNPDVVFMSSYTSDAILFTKTFKELDFNPKAVIAQDSGYLAPEFVTTVKEDCNFTMSREVFAADLGVKKPIIKTISDLYYKKYGEFLDGTTARALQGFLVLVDAINRAGSVKPAAIQKALIETDLGPNDIFMPWKGVKFDPKTHQNTKIFGIMVQYQNMTPVTVWPFDLASADLVWPLPAWKDR